MPSSGAVTELNLQIKVTIHISGALEWAYHEFEMLDNSGTDQMSIFYGNLVLLQNLEAAATGAVPSKLPFCVGVSESLLGDGSSAAEYARMIQAAIFADNNGGVMTNPGQEWDLIQCVTRDG
ncbi:hypothetical protein N7481_004280 [Penicillium waksmanii]|uniref:uncharacterized protein n=1 Tax=Penicillium waksmanii TaxID=69791 RepID=UPI002547332E|nr:uncharacterized protein N7481_004280 [Penicillium waksmanii]KAJ5989070.1 hypothetical protein N7481_004280 [Penicillium waksmanii]